MNRRGFLGSALAALGIGIPDVDLFKPATKDPVSAVPIKWTSWAEGLTLRMLPMTFEDDGVTYMQIGVDFPNDDYSDYTYQVVGNLRNMENLTAQYYTQLLEVPVEFIRFNLNATATMTMGNSRKPEDFVPVIKDYKLILRVENTYR